MSSPTSLREAKERYRSVVEDQTELICRCKPDTTLTFVNPAYGRYFGKTTDELLGRSFLEFVQANDRDAVQSYLKEFSKEEPVSTTEHRVVAANGEIRWQQWTDRAFFNDYGEITEFQSVGRDITHRVRAEEALRIDRDVTRRVAAETKLRENEEMFRLLFDQSPLGAAIIAPDFSYIRVNKALCDLTGYSETELLSRKAIDITHGDDGAVERETGSRHVSHRVELPPWAAHFSRLQMPSAPRLPPSAKCQ